VKRIILVPEIVGRVTLEDNEADVVQTKQCNNAQNDPDDDPLGFFDAYPKQEEAYAELENGSR